MSPFTNKKVEESAPAPEAKGYLDSAYQGVCNAATAVTDIFRGNIDSIAAQSGGITEVEEDKSTFKKLTSFISNKKDEAHIEAKTKAKEAKIETKEKAKEAKEEAKKSEGKVESKCEKVYDEVKQKAQKTCESAEKTFTEVKTKTVETFDKVGSASKKTFNESFEKVKSIGHCESDERSKTSKK